MRVQHSSTRHTECRLWFLSSTHCKECLFGVFTRVRLKKPLRSKGANPIHPCISLGLVKRSVVGKEASPTHPRMTLWVPLYLYSCRVCATGRLFSTTRVLMTGYEKVPRDQCRDVRFRLASARSFSHLHRHRAGTVPVVKEPGD